MGTIKDRTIYSRGHWSLVGMLRKSNMFAKLLLMYKTSSSLHWSSPLPSTSWRGPPTVEYRAPSSTLHLLFSTFDFVIIVFCLSDFIFFRVTPRPCGHQQFVLPFLFHHRSDTKNDGLRLPHGPVDGQTYTDSTNSFIHISKHHSSLFNV